MKVINQALGMLMQENCNKHRSIAYYRVQLDVVSHACSHCLKATAAAAAAAAKLVEASLGLILDNGIYLQTPPSVQIFLSLNSYL